MKSIVMIGAGIQEKVAVEKLKKNGYTVIVTDKNLDAPGVKIADFHIYASYTDTKKISSWILREKEKLNIKGIFTLIHAAYEVSVIAKTCNLPTLEPHIILVSDEKIFHKKILEENGLPIARYKEIKSINDLEKGLNEFYNLAILKTTDSYGGKGIQKIDKNTNLAEKWNDVLQVLSSGTIILEEKLDGEFIDLQGFMHNGKFYRGGESSVSFTNNLEGIGQINPIETFHISPSIQSKEIIDKAYELFEKACSICGLKWGPVGIDLIKTTKGLKIIEIGPRLHGPNGSLRIFPDSTGIEPLLFLAQLVCGDIPNEEFLKPKFKKVSMCLVYVNKPGVIQEIKIPNNSEIIDQIIYAKVGEQYNMKFPYKGTLSIFTQSNTYKDAIKLQKFLDENVICKIQH